MDKISFIKSLGKNPQFVTLVTETDVELIKEKSNPFQGLKKISYRHAILNFVYEKSVVKQLQREGKSPEEYLKHSRTNGLEYYGESKCLMTKGEQKYLWFKLEKELETKYILDGIEIDSNKLDGFIRVSKAPQTQNPLEKKIVARNIKFENIIAIKAQKQTFY